MFNRFARSCEMIDRVAPVSKAASTFASTSTKTASPVIYTDILIKLYTSSSSINNCSITLAVCAMSIFSCHKSMGFSLIGPDIWPPKSPDLNPLDYFFKPNRSDLKFYY